MNSQRRALALLATSHALNDCLAGWLLASLAKTVDAREQLIAVGAYAALAFGGQSAVALLIERASEPKRWLAASLALIAMACAAAGFAPITALAISGVASAFVHVAGGTLTLELPRPQRALGWFCAPGVVGLTFGGWLGHSRGAPALWLALVPIAVLIAWNATALPAGKHDARDLGARTTDPLLAPREPWILLVLLALTLRSALWDIVQVARADDFVALAAIAASAAIGKVLGGRAVERFGRTLHVAVALVGASCLLDIAGEYLIATCAGVALLQATIPAAIVVLKERYAVSAAHAVAYGLGLTVALGGIVAFVLPRSAIVVALPSLALIAMWRAYTERELASRSTGLTARTSSRPRR